MIGWFRVPLDAAKSLTGDHKATRMEATVDLLGRWHLGGNPGVRELMRAWDWSGDRVTKFVAEMRAWALENGATAPAERAPNKIGQRPDSDRTATGHPNQGETPTSREQSDNNRTPIGQRPDASCARDQEEEEETVDRRSDREREAPASGPAPTPTQQLELLPVVPDPDPLPAWTPAARECGGHDRRAVAGMCLDVVSAIRGEAAKPDRCATDARVVLGLWRVLGHPPPAEMAADLGAVIEWAQRAPDPLAARDIRAEGWADGTDRSRSLDTICRRNQWGDRLAAARRWAQDGKPTRPAAPSKPPSKAASALGILATMRIGDEAPPPPTAPERRFNHPSR